QLPIREAHALAAQDERLALRVLLGSLAEVVADGLAEQRQGAGAESVGEHARSSRRRCEGCRMMPENRPGCKPPQGFMWAGKVRPQSSPLFTNTAGNFGAPSPIIVRARSAVALLPSIFTLWMVPAQFESR